MSESRGNDPMTLLERLRNPQWVRHGTDPFAGASLDVAQTRKDMDEAAAKIEKLCNVLAEVRTKAIIAGAAFVRRNDDGAARCTEVLNVIDEALAESASADSVVGE